MKYFKSIIKWLCIVGVLFFATASIYFYLNKQKIVSQVTKAIGENINGKVDVDNIELSFFKSFPYFSVLLNNVNITDTAFDIHHQKFFYCKKVFLRLSIINAILNKPFVNAVTLENGKLNLFTSNNGFTNSYLLKGKKEKPRINKEPPLNKIFLKDFEVVINEQKSGKFHDLFFNNLKAKLKTGASDLIFSIDNDMLVKSLVFNKNKGSFLHNKTVTGNFIINLNNTNGNLNFEKINLEIDGRPFLFSGNFEMKGEDRQFKLYVQTLNSTYSFLSGLLPEKLQKSLSKVSLDKPFNISAEINGPLKGGEPKVYASWTVKNNSLKTNFMDFDDATFNGYFTNEVVAGLPRKDPNSRILINNFTAKWHGLPVSSSAIEIKDLSSPTLNANIHSVFPLDSLNDLLGSNTLFFNEGSGVINLYYSGPIERNDNTNSFLNGDVNIKNGSLTYIPRDVKMSDIQSQIIFKNSDIQINDLRTKVLGQTIIMNGEGKKLLSLINSNPGAAIINWKIYSPYLNLTPLTFLLKQKSKRPSNKKGILATANKLDNIIEQATLDVSFNSPKIRYNNFIAENVKANILLLPDLYALKNISMNHAGGTLNLQGSVSGLNKASHGLSLNANFKDVNVKKLFYAFENFGQSAILAENLEGNLTARIKADGLLNVEGKVAPESLKSIIDFSLKNGALINYEPIKKIQNFVFKNRDFENIKFAELKDRLEINNGEININKMEIQSSVLTLIVQGKYSNKGSTDISIQIPISNLKKRSKDFDPENKGVDKKFGTSIFLRGNTGSDGNVNFKLDIFNKFKKGQQKP